MKIDTLKKLYIAQLKDLYSAENQLLDALPKMIENATHDPLQKAFTDHLKETREQVKRIEKIFESYDFGPHGARCAAMAGLIEEAEDLMKDNEDPRVLDAAMICAAQKIEHYEIGSYGSVRAYAKLLGDDAAVALLEKTLDEERKADHTLSELAEQYINKFAMAAG